MSMSRAEPAHNGLKRDATEFTSLLQGTYAFEYDGLWYCVIILLGFCIIFWLVVAGKPCPFSCTVWGVTGWNWSC